jgi:hypothetical protein
MADALSTTMIFGELMSQLLRSSPVEVIQRTGDEGPRQRAPQIKLSIEELKVSDQFFD